MKAIVIILFVILPFEGFAQNPEDVKKFENLFFDRLNNEWV